MGAPNDPWGWVPPDWAGDRGPIPVSDRSTERPAAFTAFLKGVQSGAGSVAAGPHATALSPIEEHAFQSWVARNQVPFDPSPQSDYDMRGFYRGLVSGDPRAATAVNAGDHQLHFPDTWKTPYHATFSNESIYATPDAPRWVGNRLVTKDGTVIADETPKKAGR